MAMEAADIDALADSIVHGAQERYVADVLSILIEHLEDGVFSGSDRIAVEQLSRTVRAKLETALMQYRGEISDEAMAAAMRAFEEADARDVSALRAVYGAEAVGRAVSASVSDASTGMQEMALQSAEGIAGIVARDNVAMTEQAAAKWYEVAGNAVTAVNSGLKTLDAAMAEAVSELSGFRFVDYRSGISNQIDVAVRRHVVTQASQAGGRMTLARLKACGHELVWVSAHYGARPEHALWQGKAYSVDGSKKVDGKTYRDLRAATGYGTVSGLKGANCRHSFAPYFPGITELPDTSFPASSGKFGMTSNEYYAALQRQRELERRVRSTKRDISAMEEGGIGLESPSYVQKRLLLGRQQSALKAHCAEKKLARQPIREKAYGVARQPKALKVISREKPRFVKGSYPASQEEIDSLIENELSGIEFSSKPRYNPRISSYGMTRIRADDDGRTYAVIDIGKQRRPGKAELADSLIHEELEARIALNRKFSQKYYDLNLATNDERHVYIQKIIDRYVKMKGIE